MLIPEPDARAPVRLICFPNAGAGAASYRSFAGPLAGLAELCIAQLPGREARFAEPPHRALTDVVADLAGALAPCLDVPAGRRLAFFGHSMGALVAFELARLLRRGGRPVPERLIVSGRPAPQLPRPEDHIVVHTLPEDQLLERLRHYDGTPPELLAEPDLLEMFLPTLRADFEVVETYRYQAEDPLPCDLAAYGGLADPDVPVAAVEAWSTQASRRFRVRMFDGGHFYLNYVRDEVIAALRDDLAR